MAQISLTHGNVAIVDDCDYEFLNQWKWHISTKGYAVRMHHVNGRAGPHVPISMHRVIMSTPEGMETDHKNGNKLDNRKENLRVCTKSQNQGNAGIRADNTSGYKGVFWRKDRMKWQAQITLDGKRKHLGYFNTQEMAHSAYCQAADAVHGEFARYV